MLVFEETFMSGCFRAKTSGKLVKRPELGKDQTLEPYTCFELEINFIYFNCLTGDFLLN